MTGKIAGLVPMKAHSERVPNKNVREFNGRPLFHWILATLRSSDSIDEIVINTDSDRIATEAKSQFNATILDRPERLRGDEVSMNRIILHDVSEVNADIYLQTHCTNPMLRPETITEAINEFKSAIDIDSLFGVTPLQSRLWDKDGEPINHHRDELKPTQDLPPIYEENSNIYLFTEKSVTKRENRIGDCPMMFEMDPQEAIDIDEYIDFKIAEFLHKDRYGNNPPLSAVGEM